MLEYSTVIVEARDLLEPGEEDLNPEYFRGVSELIARLFPKTGTPTSERTLEVQKEIRTR